MPKSQNDNIEIPKIFQITELHETAEYSRRKFLKKALNTAAATGLLSAVGCAEESEFDIITNPEGGCSCHVVCTCDSEETSSGGYSYSYSYWYPN